MYFRVGGRKNTFEPKISPDTTDFRVGGRKNTFEPKISPDTTDFGAGSVVFQNRREKEYVRAENITGHD